MTESFQDETKKSCDSSRISEDIVRELEHGDCLARESHQESFCPESM